MIVKKVKTLPRLPLEGSIDLTYRCNNNCRHCWVVEPDTSDVRRSELSTGEWLDIINQARAMGTQEWAISGGEPLLRGDFVEIFSHISGKSSYCSLNTNGTLITPVIANLLKNTCSVMVSVYGADAEVNDQVTRNPGSFDATMAGISYLSEAGVRFLVQIVPMRDNFHQWDEMKALAQRLSPVWRMGASTLILSASGDQPRDEEIQAQRLAPAQLIGLDPPNIPYQERQEKDTASHSTGDRRTYSHCLSHSKAFHVDPTGSLGFCCYIREKHLRYDLKKGSFRQGWEAFLPGLAREEQKHVLFNQVCFTCELRNDCQKCPGVSFLEHRHAEAPSKYLCQVEKERHQFKRHWKTHHQRCFQIAGITIEVNSPQAIKKTTFSRSINVFAVDQPGDDVIQLEHFFSLPDWDEKSLGRLVHDQAPWLIYNKGEAWSYVGCVTQDNVRRIYRLAIFDDHYSRGRLFADSDLRFRKGNLNSLAMFPTDQVWLAQALLHRKAFYFHSCGLIVDGNGLLFIGHSRAGKTTVAKLFADRAEVLCDDRNIVRHWPGQGWCVYGTWSHGELSRVSPFSAPLKGMFFLEKARDNTMIPIENPMEIRKRLFPCLVRPLVNPQWWEEIWPLVSNIAAAIPAYVLRFDRSGAIVPLIRELLYDMTPDRVHVVDHECSNARV